MTHWLIHVRLLASESVMFPLEDWRKAHTPQAKLATLQKLGTSQSANQTHCMFTKWHYLEKTLPRKHIPTWGRSVVMRRFYQTGPQEVGVYFRCTLKPLQDHYPSVELKEG